MPIRQAGQRDSVSSLIVKVFPTIGLPVNRLASSIAWEKQPVSLSGFRARLVDGLISERLAQALLHGLPRLKGTTNIYHFVN